MSMMPPPDLPTLLLQNQLRNPMRVSATPQLALPPGPQTQVATLDDLAAQVVGGRASAIPNAIPAGVIGQLPKVGDLPTSPLGAPGPTGPIASAYSTPGSTAFFQSGQGLGGGPSSTPVNIRSAAAGVGKAGAGVMDDLAAAAGGAAGAKGLMGKLGGLPFPGSKLGKFGAGLGIGLAGTGLSMLTGGQESPLGRFFSGAGAGGGLGAGFGPAGAVIGGLAGGTLNALFGGGEDGPSPDDRFNAVMGDAGLPSEDAQEIRALYNVLKEVSGDDEAALQQVGQLIIQRMTQEQDSQNEQAKLLATQALTAEFFKPFTQQILDSAQQRAAIGERLANDLPANYQGIARMQNAAALDNATRTANAYAAQAQLLPAFATMQYQQGLANQLAQQQAMGGGGGATSLADLASTISQQQQPA